MDSDLLWIFLSQCFSEIIRTLQSRKVNHKTYLFLTMPKAVMVYFHAHTVSDADDDVADAK